MKSSFETGVIYIYYSYINCMKDKNKDKYLNILDSEELRIYSKAKSEKRRNEFLFARVLIKNILADKFSVLPETINIFKNEWGRPFIGDFCNENVNISISHSKDIVACAVLLQYDIGIDIEYKNRNIQDIIESFFHQNEVEYLLSHNANMRRDAACRIWTLKEAYMKSKGQGFYIDPKSFDVLKSNQIFNQTVEINNNYFLSVALDFGERRDFTVNIKEIDLNKI